MIVRRCIICWRCFTVMSLICTLHNGYWENTHTSSAGSTLTDGTPMNDDVNSHEPDSHNESKLNSWPSYHSEQPSPVDESPLLRDGSCHGSRGSQGNPMGIGISNLISEEWLDGNGREWELHIFPFPVRGREPARQWCYISFSGNFSGQWHTRLP